MIKYVKGEITPVVQDESKVTVAHKILKEESLLDFKLSAITLHNKIRAFSMGPGTYVMFQGKRLKIHKTKVFSSENLLPAGSVAEVSAEVLNIQCATGILSLLEVQPESKPKLKVADFLKSMSFKKGDLFQ